MKHSVSDAKVAKPENGLIQARGRLPQFMNYALLSQLVEEVRLERIQSRFESEGGHQLIPCIAQW